MKSKLRQFITANALQSIRRDNLKAVLDGIIAHATYELDQDEVNKVCEMIIETTKQNIISGNSFDKSPNFMFLRDLDAYSYADCKSLAERTILEKLVVDEVARQEKISLPDQQLSQGKTQILKQMNENEEIFNKNLLSEEKYHDKLLTDKVYDCLLEWNLIKR